MKHIYSCIIFFFISFVLKADDESSNLYKARLEQVKSMKTAAFRVWPKEAGYLYQGLHFELDKPVKTKESFDAAIRLIPPNLKKGFYKIKEMKEVDGWFVCEAGISIVAIKKGTKKLIFGFQW